MAVLAIALLFTQLARGPHVRKPPSPIPATVSSVAFLSAHVWAAYPTSLDCGIRNTTRYPALWVIPGAWNILHDPQRPAADRQRARQILGKERKIIRGDLLRAQPDLIYEDARRTKPYFKYPFDYVEFIGPLPGYHYAGKVGMYDVWAHGRTALSGPRCTPVHG